MRDTIKVHCFNGHVGEYYRFSDFVEECAADAMPIGWVYDDMDREFVAQCDRYSTVEMYGPTDDDYVEVVLCDGKPVAVIDDANISEDDLDRYETFDQLVARESAEEAARELNDAARRETRA